MEGADSITQPWCSALGYRGDGVSRPLSMIQVHEAVAFTFRRTHLPVIYISWASTRPGTFWILARSENPLRIGKATHQSTLWSASIQRTDA
jgi:hypothetical protein